MSIVAKCACGNRMAVADVHAGKTLRCSKCGDGVVVPAAASPGAGAARKKVGATPRIEISRSVIVSTVVGVVLLAIVLTMYFGPWTVGKQWAAMEPKANDAVTDVVQFSLQAYESERGMYDVARSHLGPMTEGNAVFVPPYMAFSIPRRIIVSGKTNRGNYIGTYDTANGEVSVDIEIGGSTIAGLVDVKKATGKFHVVGRVKDGNVEAESDGKPLHMANPKPVNNDL